MYVLTQVLGHMGSLMDHPHEARAAEQVSETPHFHTKKKKQMFL